MTRKIKSLKDGFARVEVGKGCGVGPTVLKRDNNEGSQLKKSKKSEDKSLREFARIFRLQPTIERLALPKKTKNA